MTDDLNCPFLKTCGVERNYKDYVYFCKNHMSMCVTYKTKTQGKVQAVSLWLKEAK